MKDKQSAFDTNEKIAAKPKKISYTRPVLQVYGSVSKLTMSNNGSAIDGNANNPGNRGMGSDRAIKEKIFIIGEHPLGIGLYLFDYKPEYREQWGFGRKFGVMADEVEKVMPEAVVVHADGYKMVNYAMLGINHTIH